MARSKIDIVAELFRDTLLDACGLSEADLPLFPTGGVCVKMTFRRRLPNACFQRRKRDHPVKAKWLDIWADAFVPDVDNLEKFILDALVGIVYTDDKQAVRTISTKLLDNIEPHDGQTKITFWGCRREDLADCEEDE